MNGKKKTRELRKRGKQKQSRKGGRCRERDGHKENNAQNIR